MHLAALPAHGLYMRIKPPSTPPAPARLQLVVWLDVLSAKARHASSLNAVLPRFVPWDAVFHARGAQAARRQAADAEDDIQDDSTEGEVGVRDAGEGSGAGGERYAVRLRGLRHPLLLGDYVRARARLERELRKHGVDPAKIAPPALLAGRGARLGAQSGVNKGLEKVFREAGLEAVPQEPQGTAAGGKGADRGTEGDAAVAELTVGRGGRVWETDVCICVQQGWRQVLGREGSSLTAVACSLHHSISCSGEKEINLACNQ